MAQVGSSGSSQAKIKKFYKEVDVARIEIGDVKSPADLAGYGIALDGRLVKTPARETLVVPTARLADLVAQEWDAQEDVIKQSDMHITSLCNTAADAVAGSDHGPRIDELMQFVH